MTLLVSLRVQRSNLRERCAVYCRSSGTIQNGFWPRATRSQLSKALRQRFGWLSQVGPARMRAEDDVLQREQLVVRASAAPRP